MDEAKNQINDLEHQEAKKQPIGTTRREQESKKIEDSVSSLWDNFKCSHIQIIGMAEEKEQEIRNLFEKIMKDNFPNLVKEIDMQVQKAQRVPDKMDAKRPTPKHIII